LSPDYSFGQTENSASACMMTGNLKATLFIMATCKISFSSIIIVEFCGSLFYDAFSVTTLYSVDDRVTSE
jgi:hypothetical protein